MHGHAEANRHFLATVKMHLQVHNFLFIGEYDSFLNRDSFNKELHNTYLYHYTAPDVKVSWYCTLT
jgi:hypothetical protein